MGVSGYVELVQYCSCERECFVAAGGPFAHVGEELSQHREEFFCTIEGKTGWCITVPGVLLPVGFGVRGSGTEVVLNRFDAEPWEVFEIMAT